MENKFLEKADTVVVFNENDKAFLSELRTEIVVSPFGIPDRLIVNTQAIRHLYKTSFFRWR